MPNGDWDYIIFDKPLRTWRRKIPERFLKIRILMSRHMSIESKSANRENVRRYMARKREEGWNKYCFLVPESVAAEMYRLKDKCFSSFQEPLFDNREQRQQKRGSDLSVLVSGRGKARGKTSGSKVK